MRGKRQNIKKDNSFGLINEVQLKTIVNESLKKCLNEIELNKLEDVRDDSNYWSGMLINIYQNWAKETENLYKVLQNRYGRGKRDYDEPDEKTQGTKLSYELKTLSDKIKGFVDRKYNQYVSFENGIEDRYMERFGGNDRDIANRFAKYSDEHGWDSIDDNEWRKNNLSPQEQDYYDYKSKYNGI